MFSHILRQEKINLIYFLYFLRNGESHTSVGLSFSIFVELFVQTIVVSWNDFYEKKGPKWGDMKLNKFAAFDYPFSLKQTE